MLNIIETMGYAGDVSISIKTDKGTLIPVVNVHNSGTMTLKKAFAMFLCGYTDAFKYKPQYLDFMSSTSESAEFSTYTSELRRLVSLSAPTFNKYTPGAGSTDEATWIASFTASIPYNLLTEAIDTTKYYAFCLKTSGTIDAGEDRALAYIKVPDASVLQNFGPATQLVVEWKTRLLNNAIE